MLSAQVSTLVCLQKKSNSMSSEQSQKYFQNGKKTGVTERDATQLIDHMGTHLYSFSVMISMVSLTQESGGSSCRKNHYCEIIQVPNIY